MILVYILVGLALIFNFLNGFHDSSNIVATIIFSRAMSPRKALALTAVAEFCGPFLFGVAVAKTIGESIISPEFMTTEIILASLIGAIFWNLFTWFFGIPSSSSHALIGGILGAVIADMGVVHIQTSGLINILIALFISPILGSLAGFLFTRLVYLLAKNATMKINWFFKKAQVLTGVALALSHGANDAQKTMGIIALGLVTSKVTSQFVIPQWVIIISSLAISLGTVSGGWRLIKTLGGKFYKIRPLNGFCTQVSSAAVILGAALLGGPVSTTQVVSSALLGVGSAERMNKIRWTVASQIVVAWFLTIPLTAAVSALFYFLIKLVI